MNEVSYYQEFSEKFSTYLQSYLPNDFKIYFSINKTLDAIISELELLSGTVIKEQGAYVPKLKVDIVFAIVNAANETRLILIEAKYLSQLSLKDYSQLVGYLQVAKTINRITFIN
ncbi:hypothetical protein CHU92_05495 [Flavobacterium cyanobacteriorum]|uniref:Uncharacterized protein n=1 Tax=Flavobacterium cyanobacteriorum TaxID=2022802 RepID=A0A255ZCK1_9FLAO|nr:hypothetical protein [Flavobacterium cyanobacteriorum]OYQ38330.1 hypothetical protein CHU92_05495 [Flavobacterium cyanobacteriorum]